MNAPTHQARTQGSESQRAIIWLAAGDAADELAAQLRRASGLAVEVRAAEELGAVGQVGDWVVLAGLSAQATVELAEIALAHGLRVAVEASGRQALYRALGRPLWGVPMIVLSPEAEAGAGAAATRLRDLVLGGGALTAASPFLAVFAALVKRSSPGPVFYRTRVVGRLGREFTWSKLRTMRVAGPEDEARRREQVRAFLASEATGEQRSATSLKIVDESRVTPIGRFLRRHSLDELPQLWNVVRGEMSLVGPRPCLPYEYELLAPWQRLRYRVTPGLTGLWQVCGRSEVTFSQMLVLDYLYVTNWSLWGDIKLILRTVPALMGKTRGAS